MEKAIWAKKTCANILFNSLLYLHNVEYVLYCFCIMPNHFHIIFRHFENARDIDKIMQSVKGYSAIKINETLNRKGALWQSESYDHIIRDEDELYRAMNYVMMNPVKANLIEYWKDWKYTYLNEELFDII